jgi:hypothetical protein
VTTQAKRLVAAGVEIIGADGEPRTIKFDFAALERVEERFESVTGAVDVLKSLIEARNGGFDKPVMADLRALLDAALRPRTADDVFDELAAVRLHVLIDALVEAWIQAWPPASADEGNVEAPVTERSNGRTSSGGRRRGSAAATSSSGA